jgi:signal transduction histidine kinase
MVVHDMRSPLMVMKAHLGFLKMDLTALTEQQAEDLRAATAASDVLERMANDLLDVSKLEAGQMPLQLASCDLVGLAGAVVEELAPVDRSRTIDLSSWTPIVQVRCDGDLIRRVLANMVGNAIKHTPAGGRIDLAIAPGQDSARVTIQDQGPGVPPEARARIFEKFGTVVERRSARFHSAGLGLAFCKLAIEAHGGMIGVDAAAERGSLFWFELPA